MRFGKEPKVILSSIWKLWTESGSLLSANKRNYGIQIRSTLRRSNFSC